MDADSIMGQVERCEAPLEALALVPLMKNGGEAATMSRWRGIVAAVPNLNRRGDCALAVVYAAAVGLRRQWELLVEGLTVIESPVVADWKRQSRDLGKIEGKIEAVLELLGRHGGVPADLEAKIRASQSADEIRAWLLMASASSSIDHFRQDAGL